jgi:hypothetical protein
LRGPLARLSVVSAIAITLSSGSSQTTYTAPESVFQVVLKFAATDVRSEFTVPLSRDVVLDVRRAVDAQGRHMGWDLAARDQRLAGSSNFFYECLCGHGPRPHDYYAWHFVSKYYPHERHLPVYGYPLEVHVRCPDCQVTERMGPTRDLSRGTLKSVSGGSQAQIPDNKESQTSSDNRRVVQQLPS